MRASKGPAFCFTPPTIMTPSPCGARPTLLMIDGRESTDWLFAQLADGGDVTTPLGMQPWGDYYGKFTDRFGVQWMLNCPIRSRPQQA